MTDYALDALLAEYVAPAVPEGLAARVAAAALALPQEPRAAAIRRAAPPPRRGRRRAWLRRPLLVGGVALGLAVSGAVAATLAGIRVDWPAIEALLPDLPFLRDEAPAATPRTHPAPPQSPAPTAAPAAPAPAPQPALRGPATDDERAVPPPPPQPALRDPPPVTVPDPAPARPERIEPRLVETRPAIQPLGPAIESTRSAPPAVDLSGRPAATPPDVAIQRPAATAADQRRLQQEQLERTERLRAARQAQIERLQRVQQRRERLRRLRRD